jgi:hypothetical protein
MNKIVSFLVVLATFVFTGCDARWTGGVDPTPPPVVNNYSLFPQPQPQVQVQPAPAANASPIIAPLVLNTTQPQLQKAEAQSGSGARMETVWHPFKLPSRERPGMWKMVNVKVELPVGVDLNTRNYAIAQHAAKLYELGKCVEDYLPLARSGPRQVR